MKKKLTSVSFWLLVFFSLIVVEAYSAFGQSAQIVGSWKNGSVGAIQYQNRTTGSTRPGRGSLFTYKFLPNGNYEFVGYMEVTMYNCTTKLFNQIAGRYTVEGSTLYLNPSRDFWKNTNSCAVSGNKETTKTPAKKQLEFQTKTDDYGSQLLCLNEAGSETCFKRESE